MSGPARLLFGLTALAIVVVTLGPIGLRPESGLPPEVERFGAFLTLGVLWTLAYPRRRAAGWLALMLAAALLEGLQNEVPGRHGLVLDFDAKALGVLAGAAGGVGLGWLGRRVRRA